MAASSARGDGAGRKRAPGGTSRARGKPRTGGSSRAAEARSAVAAAASALTAAAPAAAAVSTVTETARAYKRELLQKLFGNSVVAVAEAAVATTTVGGRRAAPAGPRAISLAAAIPRHSAILGVGFGAKMTAGKIADDLAVRVYVRAKLPRAELPKGQEVPSEVNGLPTDVVPVGDLAALARPTSCGVSVGHFAITAGTLGCLVRRTADPQATTYILSNNHVLANVNAAQVGDSILEPGPLDGGDPNDPIARLTDFQQIDLAGGQNTIDAAIAELIDPAAVTADVLKIGAVQDPPVQAALYQSVRKHGRTTLHTVGVVVDLAADVRVRYGTQFGEFADQLTIVGAGGSFSDGGDSGSLVVDAVSRRPVGLLFAGGGTQTFVNPIDPILTRFGIQIL